VRFRRRTQALRVLAFLVIVTASLAAIVAVAARPRWSSDLLPMEQRILAAGEFRVVAGTGEPVAGGLRVRGTGKGEVALQTMLPDGGFDAGDFAVLRYRFDELPRTLEVSFLFRRADRPADVQTVSLPWPGRGIASFALSELPEWRGRIIEVGFAEYPTPQAIPPRTGFAPFVLRDAELWSASWRGAMGVLATEWSGYWPWSQRSVHALGRDVTRQGSASLVLAVACVAAGIVLWAFLLLGLRGRALGAFAAACAGIAWLALDLHWQSSLQWRLGAARDVYAQLDYAQRTETVVDASLRDVANQVRQQLADARDGAHVLVAADSAYTVLRLVWHLQPLNVAIWSQVLGDGRMPTAGTWLVVYDAPSLRGSPQFARILARSRVATVGGLAGHAGLDANPLVFQYVGTPEGHRMHEASP
jgi:hypothetical protein